MRLARSLAGPWTPKSVGHVHGFTSASLAPPPKPPLAVSGAVRDDLVAQGIPADRITVLRNALDADEFRPYDDWRPPWPARDATTPVIGSFGHLSGKKGYRELFAAMPKCGQGVPQRPSSGSSARATSKASSKLRARDGGYSTASASPVTTATPPT